jgi:hypothetical protein
MIIAAPHDIKTSPGEDDKFILKLMDGQLKESEETERVRSGNITQ